MPNFKDSLVQNAADFYVMAIGKGKPAEAIEKYVGNRYVQHNLKVADGKNGFIENFRGFTERIPQRDIRVIRGFRDHDMVFLHVLQDLGEAGLWVTMDFFGLEEGKIVEHWDNIQKAESREIADQMIEGPVELGESGQTEANKVFVQRFLRDGILAGNRATVENMVYPHEFRHHHHPQGGDWASFLDKFEESGREYLKLHRVISSGNFVATQVEGRLNDQATAFYDLYRLDRGRIVENWMLPEVIPARDRWKHQNGKF